MRGPDTVIAKTGAPNLDRRETSCHGHSRTVSSPPSNALTRVRVALEVGSSRKVRNELIWLKSLSGPFIHVKEPEVDAVISWND